MRQPVVSVLMDLPAGHAYHRATVAALGHAAAHLSMAVDVRVVRTDQVGSVRQLVTDSTAIVVGPGSPYVDPDAAIAAVRAAREAGVPLVGT